MYRDQEIETIENFLGTFFIYNRHFVFNQELLVGKTVKANSTLLSNTRN